MMDNIGSDVNMKCILVCVFLTLAIQNTIAKIKFPDEMVEMLDHLQKTCEQETGVDPAIIEAAKNMNIQPDAKLKCFLKCMLTNMQLMSEDGVFNRDTAVAHIPEEIKALGAIEIIDKCKDTQGDDPCDTAFHLIMCFAREAPKIAEIFT